MAQQNDTRIFKLTKLNPVGFKVDNYPVKICLLCRGYLTEVCNDCFEKKNEKCAVMRIPANPQIETPDSQLTDSYYHAHCYNMIKVAEKKPVAKPKKVADSSDDDSD
jgi:hypothetical protein